MCAKVAYDRDGNPWSDDESHAILWDGRANRMPGFAREALAAALDGFVNGAPVVTADAGGYLKGAALRAA